MQHRLKWQMASLLMLTMWAWGWKGTETKASKVAFFDNTSTTDLGAEGEAQFDAFGVQRVVPPIVRRQVPQPGNDSQSNHAQIGRST